MIPEYDGTLTLIIQRRAQLMIRVSREELNSIIQDMNENYPIDREPVKMSDVVRRENVG